MYRTPQQETNDVIGFGMFLMLMGITVGLVKSVVTNEPESQRKHLPMTLPRKPVVTVTCPVCHKVIEIPEYNGMTRSDALKRHIDREHKSTVGLYPQAILIEGGEKIPSQYRGLIGWIGEPLLGYSLAVDLLPAVETEVKARRIDEVLKQLKDGVEGIQDSYQFRLFLTTMSKFHDYSIGNQILIMIQKPEATRVAGFSTWKDLGRWVRKGEKGIAILAPVMPPKPKPEEREYDKTEAETEIEPRPVFFKVVYVFDVSQTEGKLLPEFEVPVLAGEVNEELFTDLLTHIRQRGVNVDFESKPSLDPGVKGFYSHAGIWVRPEEPRAQQLKTLLHEIAHYYSEGVFHIPRQDAETIAESAAFVVGTHFGFDTGVRSFPYVALWAKDKKVLENNLGAIRRVSTTIIEALEEIRARTPV
ncbi:MAG: ArdC family protein [Dehalococcoidales bacterium]|nr:ArdC family protein [Dehalococcoidales bacterium]